MYLNFYGLKQEPFHITPDPEFLYLSPSHKEALAAIIYGVRQRKGFVAIIGAVGVGKTTILRSYLDSADKKQLKIIYVFNARLTFDGLLKTIYQELGLQIETNDSMEMVNKLYEVLIEEYKQGNTVVLVIDEAQNMPIETLEKVRMLSNLETAKDKLIQIVLIGQTEFEESLNLNQLRQLKQRIAIRATILPLTDDETFEYIKYRLHKAGGHSHAIFTQAALKVIVKRANGIPRVINILTDNALVTGFGYQQKPVDAKIVKEVISDFDIKKKHTFGRWRFALTLTAVILIIGTFFSFYYDKVTAMHFAAKGLFERGIAMFPEARVPSRSNNSSQQVSHKGKEKVTDAGKQASVRSKDASTEPEASPLNVVLPDKNQANVEETPQASRKRTFARPKGATKPARYTGLSPTSEREGDTAVRSAEDGRSDGKLITLMQENKPKVVDSNLIKTGSTINLPQPAGE